VFPSEKNFSLDLNQLRHAFLLKKKLSKFGFLPHRKHCASRLMPLREIGYIWSDDNLTRAAKFCGGILRVFVMIRNVVRMLKFGFRGLKLIRFFT